MAKQGVKAMAEEDVLGSGGGDNNRFSGGNLEDRYGELNSIRKKRMSLIRQRNLKARPRRFWLGIFRVHTSKTFSHVALFKAMRNVWASSQGVTFKPMEYNLFLVQFLYIGDGNRVMGGEPWVFRGSTAVLEECVRLTNVPEYKLYRIPVWARIMGVPKGLM